MNNLTTTDPFTLSYALANSVSLAVHVDIPSASPLRPSALDRSPHTIRLVAASTYEGTEAPFRISHTWVGVVRGSRRWLLRQLVTLPAQTGQPNLFLFAVSVDGWPISSGAIEALVQWAK